MSGLLDVLKPHFFPHYACFQYGVGGYELWLARHCVEYVVATNTIHDCDYLVAAKERLGLPSLTVYLDCYCRYLLKFKPDHFNVMIFYAEPIDLSSVSSEVTTRLKPGGYLVLPTRQRPEIVLDWKEIGEGVYRKP